MSNWPPQVTTKQVYLAYLRGEVSFDRVVERASQNADAYWGRQAQRDPHRPEHQRS